jgi:hypothetical protein
LSAPPSTPPAETPSADPVAASEPRSDTRIADRLYGGVGGAAVLMAILFFLFGQADGGTPAVASAEAVPQLRILSPAAGAELEQPVVLEFDAGAELARLHGGWAAGDLHLHLYAGDTEVMPGPGDLQRLSGTRYQWRLPRLPPGERTLRVQWAGLDHRSMTEGASEPLPVLLR